MTGLTTRRKAISVVKELPVEIDLGLLAVYDPNPIDDKDYLFVSPVCSCWAPWVEADRINDLDREDREQTLLMNARDGMQLLINEIWTRPTRIVDDGVVAELPAISTPLPREKPVRLNPSTDDLVSY